MISSAAPEPTEARRLCDRLIYASADMLAHAWLNPISGYRRLYLSFSRKPDRRLGAACGGIDRACDCAQILMLCVVIVVGASAAHWFRSPDGVCKADSA
jgi:hypothetical protein